MKIVLATTNRKKADEMRRIFSGLGVEFLTLDRFPDCPEVVEDGKTFRANAVKKAVTIARHTGLPAIADDSGLEVQALGGDPGVFSARYAGEQSTDQENVRKLLHNMRSICSPDERTARFACCVAFALPDGHYKTFTGYVKGHIGRKQKGENGFGYDPLFYPLGHKRTFAEMTSAEKDSMSHRGRAMKKLLDHINKRFSPGHAA